MKKINQINTLFFFIAFSLIGCASQELQRQRKQLVFDHLTCITNKSIFLDDGVSSIKDIANDAILLCGKEEEALIHLYDAPYLRAETRRLQREGAYKVALLEITNNRKKMAGNQNTRNCTMQIVHDSCYKVGNVNKSVDMCSEISENIRDVSSKSITDKSTLMGVQTLCYHWCINGIDNKPFVAHEELCK